MLRSRYAVAYQDLRLETLCLKSPLSSLDGGLVLELSSWWFSGGFLQLCKLSLVQQKKEKKIRTRQYFYPHICLELPAAVGFGTNIVVCQCQNGCHVLVVLILQYIFEQRKKNYKKTCPARLERPSARRQNVFQRNHFVIDIHLRVRHQHKRHVHVWLTCKSQVFSTQYSVSAQRSLLCSSTTTSKLSQQPEGGRYTILVFQENECIANI